MLETASKLTSKSNRIVLNLSFQTSPPQITERAVGIAEAFGIGVDDVKTFTVFNNVTVQYNDTDLIYVTGDSGSGKSSFLRLFAEHEKQRGRRILNFDEIKPDSNEVLIDSVGKDLNEATRILSIAGLSEAFLMLRRYKELSEGQKYRYKLAKMIDQDADVFLVDEFGATLDREMAKVLAYTFQKWARRNKKQLVIASTHTDLLEDFNPDILILKRVGEYTNVQYFDPKPRPFSLIREMKIQKATIEDYEQLEEFHYKGTRPAFVRQMYKLVWKHHIVAVIVYTAPFLRTVGRDKLFPEYRDTKRLNREVLRISRVIVNPKFRGAGIAYQFVRQCNKLTGARLIETLAVMAKYNPFFQKAGMTIGGISKPTATQDKIMRILLQKGFKPYQLYSAGGRKQFLNSLSPEEFKTVAKLLWKASKGMGGISKGRQEQYTQRMLDGDLNHILGRTLHTEKVYLYWLNPNWKPNLSSSD